MKILFYSHFYYPEVGAGSVRTQYFVKALKEAGHEVKVVTPKPNYPAGKVYPGFETGFKFDEENNVAYLPIFIPKKHSLLGRGFTYLSYFLSSSFYVLFDSFKPDVIITSSPPITTTLAAVIVSKLKRKPIIVDIRDLWPDIGVKLGIIKNKFLIYFLKLIDLFIIKSAEKIIVPLKSFEGIISEKGAKGEIITIYNGADTSVFKPLSKEEKEKVRKELALPIDKKIAVYFGFFNFGMNDVDLLAEAITLLTDKKDLHFLFIGDGTKKKDFENKIIEKVSYSFVKPLPASELSKVIASCDLSVIPLKKIKGSTGGFIPVKCLESWAVGLPVILTSDDNGELLQIFDKARGGEIVPTDSPDKLASVISNVMLQEDFLREAGQFGRRFVEENFDRRKQSEKINKIINSL